MSDYCIMFKAGTGLRQEVGSPNGQFVSDGAWVEMEQVGLPVQVVLLSVTGTVKTGPADGLVEVRGEGSYCVTFDSIGFQYYMPRERKAALAVMEAHKWPIEEEQTWLSRLLPCWVKPKKCPVPKIFVKNAIHVILPLTDIEIIWPQSP